jgi:DNA-binding beta-propeller fold protein YncE
MRVTFPCLLIAVVLSLVAPARGAGPLLLVLNKGDLTMAIVDPVKLTVTGRVPTGPDPHEVDASADGTHAYIANYGRGNGATNTITVVDLLAKQQEAPIDLGMLSRPHGLHFTGGKLYFAAEGARMAGRIDPSSRKVEWTVSTGPDGPHMIIATADHTKAFTTNRGTGSVSILERGDGAGDWRVTNVAVGRGAEGFDLSPDGKELWTANASESTVSIVDVRSKAVVQTVRVPFSRANRLKFTPDGTRALISDLGGRELIVMDAAARREIQRIDVKGGAAGLLVEPSGARAFLSVGSQSAVAVIDLKAMAVSSWIQTGPNPDGLAWVH